MPRRSENDTFCWSIPPRVFGRFKFWRILTRIWLASVCVAVTFALNKMRNMEFDKEVIKDALDAKTSGFSVAFIRLLFGIGVGLIVACYFIYEATQDNVVKVGGINIISNQEYTRCASTDLSTSVGLQCAFEEESNAWMCVAQNQPIAFRTTKNDNRLTLGTAKDFCTTLSIPAVYCSKVRGELKCACINDQVAPTPTRNNGIFCARSSTNNWVCLSSAHALSLSNVTLLATTLPPTMPSDQTLSCILSEQTGHWRCGDMLKCMSHDRYGLSCWGGDTSAVGDAQLFSETRDRIARVSNKSGDDTGLYCQFNAQKNICKCLTLEANSTSYQVR